MLTKKLQKICDNLMNKRAQQADKARIRATAELEGIKREMNAYCDGAFDMMKAVLQMEKELPDYIKTLDAVKPELKAALLNGDWPALETNKE